MPKLKNHVCVVLRRESGLLSIKGSKLQRHTGSERDAPDIHLLGAVFITDLQTHHSYTRYKPVVTDGRESSDVQHQRGVQRAWLGRLALRWRRALVTQHARARHPPQLGALPWLLLRHQRGSVLTNTLVMCSECVCVCVHIHTLIECKSESFYILLFCSLILQIHFKLQVEFESTLIA